jgi:putative effector of murein hydrolase LrgA (UPF0299 family)
MLAALTGLFACQLAGEFLVRALGLPLPGPVLGLLLLLLFLVLRGSVPKPLEETAGSLLRHLGLLFVPAGVGVITQLEPIAGAWPGLLVALVVSTALGLVGTGWLYARMARRRKGREA